MAEKFDFTYTNEFDIVARRDESGDLYVERSRGIRAFWALIGLAVAAGAGWYALNYEGPEGWLLSTATPATVGALALLGAVAEAIVGSERSSIHEADGRYGLEMMVSSRLYVAAAAVGAVMAGVSVVLQVRAPGIVGAAGPRRGLARMAESIPFGDVLVLAVGATIGGWLLYRAVVGRMPVEHKYTFESDPAESPGV